MSPLPPLTLLDGGLGTTLADQHGVVFDDSTPLWSSSMLLTSQGLEVLSKVQKEFVREGADVLLTDTYQASYEGWARSVGQEGKGKEDAARGMRSAVAVAREALASEGKGRGEKGKVVLGLGAYGATMIPGQEYSGNYDEAHNTVDKLQEWHLERLSAFVALPSDESEEEERKEKERCWQNIDMLAFETLPRIDEVRAVRQLMSSLHGAHERRYWISCVFPGEGKCLPDGSTVGEVVSALVEGEGKVPWGIGLNCTKIGKVEGLVMEFEEELAKVMGGEGWPALVVYPDGTQGEVYNTSTKVWEKKGGGSGSEMSWDEEIYGIVQRARERRKWSEVLVGGCCKVTPQDIGRLGKRIDAGEN